MSALAIIAILLAVSVLFTAGVVFGALLSWASYEEGFRDGAGWQRRKG